MVRSRIHPTLSLWLTMTDAEVETEQPVVAGARPPLWGTWRDGPALIAQIVLLTWVLATLSDVSAHWLLLVVAQAAIIWLARAVTRH
ncbi:hypothetical protein [Humibacillus xanthopallidus]|uniref:hypothetical protein n=1 Tax=Humibacillus xanthopallidus TaxID=412689 RepID=UPI00384DE3EF